MANVRKRFVLQIWKDVIFALFLREIKSKFDDKLGVSWAVIQPVSFIFMLSYLRGRMDGGVTHSMPSFVFIVYGMLIITFFLTTLSSTTQAIKKNKSLFAFRQVQPISAVIAVALFEYIIKVAIILVIVVIMYFLGFELIIYNPLIVILNLTLVWLIATSLGLIFSIVNSFMIEFDKVRALMQRPMFFISGTFFSLQDLPKDTWKYFDWNPVLHAIELSRQAAYPNFGAVGVSQTFLNLFALLCVFFSLAVYRIYWKQAISR